MTEKEDGGGAGQEEAPAQKRKAAHQCRRFELEANLKLQPHERQSNRHYHKLRTGGRQVQNQNELRPRLAEKLRSSQIPSAEIHNVAKTLQILRHLQRKLSGIPSTPSSTPTWSVSVCFLACF